MPDAHLFEYSVSARLLNPWCQHTDCSSNFLCSLRLTTMRSSNLCFFFWSNSSAWSLSFSCCFFSMSARRLCAADEELWESVPKSAPNNRCPRLRSSTLPFLRRSARRSAVRSVELSAGMPSWDSLLVLSMLRRGRLLPASDTDDCLRLGAGLSRGGVVVAAGGGELSGTKTAEARTLGIPSQWGIFRV